MTFTTVGLPCFKASVKKIVPTAEPAKPEKTRYPQVRASILGISPKREARSGRNMIRMTTCSQKTITSASNSVLSGMRHALSVPHSAAPRPTSQGPYVLLLILRFCMQTRCGLGASLRQCAAGRQVRYPRVACIPGVCNEAIPTCIVEERLQNSWLLQFIFNLPVAISFLIVSAIPTLFALAGLYLVRRKYSAEVLKENHEVAAIIFNAFGLFYGVMVAFVVFVTWSGYSEARKDLQMEANQVADIFHSTEAFPDS